MKIATLSAALLAALAMTLTGCADETPNYPPADTFADSGGDLDTLDPIEPPVEPQPLDANPEDVFVTLVQDEYPGSFGYNSADDLIDLGKSICEGYDAGLTFVESVTLGMESGYGAEEVGFLNGAAIGAFCPEHESVLPDAGGF